jgi:hypothetical protein
MLADAAPLTRIRKAEQTAPAVRRDIPARRGGLGAVQGSGLIASKARLLLCGEGLLACACGGCHRRDACIGSSAASGFARVALALAFLFGFSFAFSNAKKSSTPGGARPTGVIRIMEPGAAGCPFSAHPSVIS